MGSRIIGAGLLGWGAIIALAWWLADRRIEICDYVDEPCRIATTADRDFVLAFGLSVALAVIVGAALVHARRSQRLSHGFSQASRVHRLPAE